MPSLPAEMIVILAPFAQLFSERVVPRANLSGRCTLGPRETDGD